MRRHSPILFPHCVVLALILGVFAADLRADQYESEQRIISDSDAEGTVVSDPEALLKQLDGNDYGKALLLRQLAAEALRKNQQDKAAAYLQRAMRLNALSSYAQEDMQRALVHLYATTGQHRKLIAALGPNWKSDSSLQPELLVALANAYVQLDRYKEAIGPITKGISLRKSPDESWLRLKLSIEVKLKRYKSAVRTVESLIRQVPKDRELWLQLANLQLRLKQERKAVATLALAHQQKMLTGRDEQLLYVRLLYKTGAPYQAASLLQSWLRKGELSDGHEVQSLLASAWDSAKEKKQAAAALATVAKRENRGDTWLRLAKIEVDLGNWKSATTALRSALKAGGLGANRGAALMTLGIAEYQQDNKQAATEAFNSALKIKATGALAAQWLDYLQFEEDRQAEKSK